MADPLNFKRAEQVAPFADFHGGDTYPLLLTAASGDMTAHRQDVRVNLILCQLLTSEAGMAVQGFILPQALFTQTLCKFTQILQLPQNTKGGIARC